MAELLKYCRIAWLLLLPWLAQPVSAQSVNSYTSLSSWNSALPTADVVSRVETFSSVSTNYSISQGAGDSWNGFSVLASGSGSFGISGYCPQLSDPQASFPTTCTGYNANAPSVPGIVGAFATPGLGNGTVTFTPTGRAVAFAFNHVDWNDSDTGVERSAIRVFLSDGSSTDISGPTPSSAAPVGFLGVIVDSDLIDAGVQITSILWYGLEDELVGIYNVRTTDRIGTAQLAVTKNSDLWDPAGEGKFSIPGNEMFYRIEVRNTGDGAVDSGSLFILDSLPDDVELWNGDIDSGGPETFTDVAPVGFEQVTGSGVLFDPSADLRFSTALTPPSSFNDCVAIPMDSSFRSDIRYICIRPQGVLGHGGSTPRIDFAFRVRIR
ncbi:MAG: hypothetical protein AAF067_11240 [Pseudomonadota bacterium]